MIKRVPDRRSVSRVLPLAFVAGAALGCEPEPADFDDDAISPVGRIGFNLVLPDSSGVETLTYNITGPSSRKGSFPIAGGGTSFTAMINGLKAGSGYDMALSAIRSQGASCFGSSRFTVQANQTTTVNVKLSCPGLRGPVGNVLVNGEVNVCPVVESASGSPVGDGTKIQLSSSASDEDGTSVEIEWVAPKGSGTFVDASSGSTLFQCATNGRVELEVSVSDGDCGDVMTVPVTCSKTSSNRASSVVSRPIAGKSGQHHAKTAAGGAGGGGGMDDDPTDAAGAGGASGAAGAAGH